MKHQLGDLNNPLRRPVESAADSGTSQCQEVDTEGCNPSGLALAANPHCRCIRAPRLLFILIRSLIRLYAEFAVSLHLDTDAML